MQNEADNEIFLKEARRCKRCNGLLTSEQALKDGYGHTCLKKVMEEGEAKRPIDRQMTFDEYEDMLEVGMG